MPSKHSKIQKQINSLPHPFSLHQAPTPNNVVFHPQAICYYFYAILTLRNFSFIFLISLFNFATEISKSVIEGADLSKS